MRPFGSPKQLENRRRKAVALFDSGLSLSQVAKKVGCHASSVMRWRDSRETQGESGLNPKPAPGRPPKLSAKQKKRLIALLLRGAMANGYRTELWTTARVAAVIARTFGVHYHRDHIGRLLASLGWSYQKPERRALERDEPAIDEWKRREWPRVKKTLRGWAPTSSSSTSRVSS